jgi:hypothetical protein
MTAESRAVAAANLRLLAAFPVAAQSAMMAQIIVTRDAYSLWSRKHMFSGSRLRWEGAIVEPPHLWHLALTIKARAPETTILGSSLASLFAPNYFFFSSR